MNFLLNIVQLTYLIYLPSCVLFLDCNIWLEWCGHNKMKACFTPCVSDVFSEDWASCPTACVTVIGGEMTVLLPFGTFTITKSHIELLKLNIVEHFKCTDCFLEGVPVKSRSAFNNSQLEVEDRQIDGLMSSIIKPKQDDNVKGMIDYFLEMHCSFTELDNNCRIPQILYAYADTDERIKILEKVHKVKDSVKCKAMSYLLQEAIYIAIKDPADTIDNLNALLQETLWCNDMLALIEDKSSHHIILEMLHFAKATENVDLLDIILKAVTAENVLHLSMGQYSYRVIMRLTLFKEHTEELFNILADSVDLLLCDRLGNFVVSASLKMNNKDITQKVFDYVMANIRLCCTDLYGNHVVQALLLSEPTTSHYRQARQALVKNIKQSHIDNQHIIDKL